MHFVLLALLLMSGVVGGGITPVLAQDGTPQVDYVALGNAALEARDFEVALMYFNRALDFNPRSIEAINGRAQAYYGLGDYAATIEDYTTIIELGEATSVTYYNRGLAYSAQGEWEQSNLDLTRVIEADAELAPAAYVTRGYNYFAQDAIESALEDFDAALRLRPDYAPAYLERGKAMLAQGDQEEALANFNRAIGLDVEYAEAYHTRGILYFQQGNFEAALLDFNRTLALDPHFPNAYYNRGNVYVALDNYEAALNDYFEAYNQNENLEGLVSAGSLLAHYFNDFQAAIDTFNIVLAIEPERPEVLAERGWAFFNLYEYFYAIDDLDQALALDPDYMTAYVYRAHTRLAQGDVNGAYEDFDAALALEPQYIPALLGRAYLHLSLDNTDAAIRDFEAYIAIIGQGSDPEIEALLAELKN